MIRNLWELRALELERQRQERADRLELVGGIALAVGLVAFVTYMILQVLMGDVR